jgi:hypothetical protein
MLYSRPHASVAQLVPAIGLGPIERKLVGVRVPPLAPIRSSTIRRGNPLGAPSRTAGDVSPPLAFRRAMTSNPLLGELRAAFPPVPLGANDAFHMYDDRELCERAVDGKTWMEVDPRVIANRSDALAFLDDERFLAWLPMYLRLLEVVDPAQCSVLDTLVGKLTRPDPATSSKRQQRRFEEFSNRLTVAQRRAVTRSLLRFVASAPRYADGALVALKRHWAAFE